MPALPNVPQVIRIILKQSQSSGDLDVINRFYLQYTGAAPTNTQLNTMAAQIAVSWGNNIAPLVHANGSLTQVTIQDLTSPTAAVGTAAVAVVGTRAGTVLSAAACAVVSAKISRRYRGGHPRYYLDAGVEADLLTRSTWTAAFATSVGTGWQAFMNGITSPGWAGQTSQVQATVSFYAGFHNVTFPSGRVRPVPTLRVTPVIDTITSYVGSQKIGSQRRRNLQSV